jgi:hypothetical protein
MSKHTPGPWSYGIDHDPTAWWIYGDTGDGMHPRIAKVEFGIRFHHTDEAEEAEVAANARLIAAAPKMLAALKAAKNHLYNGFEPDNQCQAYHDVVAVIREAEGV